MSPVNFSPSVSSQLFPNYTQFYTTVNSSAQSSSNNHPKVDWSAADPAKREYAVNSTPASEREATISNNVAPIRTPVVPKSDGRSGVGSALAIGGGVLLIGYGILSPDITFTTKAAALLAGLALFTSGCGSPMSQKESTPNDIHVTPWSGFQNLFSGVQEAQYLGGDFMYLNLDFNFKATGLDAYKTLTVSVYMNNGNLASQYLVSKENSCKPSVGNISDCVASCQAVNAGVAIMTDIDGNPLISASDNNTIDASIYTDAQAFDGPRVLVASSNGQAFMSGNTFNVIDAVKDQVVDQSFTFSGAQFLSSFNNPVLVDESADMCNFSLAQFQNLTTGVSGFPLLDWHMLTPDNLVPGVKNYGRTLTPSLTGTLPAFIDQASSCAIFGSGQNQTTKCDPITLSPNPPLVDIDSGSTVFSYTIDQNLWKPYGLINGTGHVRIVIPITGVYPELHTKYFGGVQVDLTGTK